MNQACLNFETPRSRKADPPGSARAERSMQASGAMRGQRLLTLELVKKFPGRSSKELATLGTLDRYQLARRLPELVELGHVRVTQHQAEDQKWWAA